MSKRSGRTYEVQLRFNPETKAMNQLQSGTQIAKIWNRMDENQRAYYRGTKEKRVSIVDAKAGTGKTTIAFASGIEEIALNKGLSRIMYVRFPDDDIQSLGFLPGDIDEKGSQYFGPAYNTLVKCGVQMEATDTLREMGVLEFVMTNTMRGADEENAFVIIDEAQNARKYSDIQKVLTRFHDNCRIVLIGHSGQQDNKNVQMIKGYTPFQLYQIHLLKKKWTQRFGLIVDYRGELCRWSDDIGETIKEL